MKNLPTRTKRKTLEERARRELSFIYDDPDPAKSAALAINWELTSDLDRLSNEYYPFVFEIMRGDGITRREGVDALSITPAPVETEQREFEFTNGLGDQDSYAEPYERVITGWYPTEPSCEQFLMSIDVTAPRDKVFKDLRAWFWKFSRENPSEKKHRVISAKSILLHMAIVRLDRAGLDPSQITQAMRRVGRKDWETIDVSKDNVRDSRKYIRRICARVQRAAHDNWAG